MELTKFIWTPLLCAFLGTSSLAELSSDCNSKLANKDATILVPNAAGGGYDTYARAIAPFLENHTGMNVRVVNKPAGGGLVAQSIAYNSGQADLILLISNVGDLAITPTSSNDKTPMLAGMDVLSVVYAEPKAWVVAKEIDLSSRDLKEIVAAEGSIEESIATVTLVGKALGINTKVVAGYSGTTEYIAAILRGEVDMMTSSLQTALKRTKANDAYVALILSGERFDEAQDALYLLGDGGLIENRSLGLSEQDRRKRQYYGEIAANLTQAVRGISMSRKIPLEIRDCMRDALKFTLAEEELLIDLRAQGRSVEQAAGLKASRMADQILKAAIDSEELLLELLEEQKVN